MKIVFVKDIIHSTKRDKDYFVVRYALVNEKKEIVAKSSPLLWLSKEMYESLNI